MNKEKLFHQQLEFLIEMLLDDYSDWLHNKGYIDSDYYAEKPTAVKKYMKESHEKQGR